MKAGAFRTMICGALSCAGITLLPCTTHAQSAVDAFPTKPVRVVVPFSPGGAVDVQARLFSQRLSEKLGRPFVVDNRAGAAGTIAYALVAKANPDGYTLVAVSSDFAITPSLYENLNYDPIRDFAPISLVSEAPLLMVVHPSFAGKSAKELLALARDKPGSLNFSSGGQGTSLHIALELLKQMAKVDIVHVPYKGGGPALSAAIAGQVNGLFSNMIGAYPHVKSGKLRALAVTGAQRTAVAPELPTIAESGVPGYVTTAWSGWLAPSGTPPAMVARISRELSSVLKTPDIAERLFASGGSAIGSTPEVFRQHIGVELPKYARVIREGGLRVQ